MPTPKDSIVVHLTLKKDDYNKFIRMFVDSKILRIFLERAFLKALNSKDFFDSVFFSEV